MLITLIVVIGNLTNFFKNLTKNKELLKMSDKITCKEQSPKPEQTNEESTSDNIQIEHPTQQESLITLDPTEEICSISELPLDEQSEYDEDVELLKQLVKRVSQKPNQRNNVLLRAVALSLENEIESPVVENQEISNIEKVLRQFHLQTPSQHIEPTIRIFPQEPQVEQSEESKCKTEDSNVEKCKSRKDKPKRSQLPETSTPNSTAKSNSRKSKTSKKKRRDPRASLCKNHTRLKNEIQKAKKYNKMLFHAPVSVLQYRRVGEILENLSEKYQLAHLCDLGCGPLLFLKRLFKQRLFWSSITCIDKHDRRFYSYSLRAVPDKKWAVIDHDALEKSSIDIILARGNIGELNEYSVQADTVVCMDVLQELEPGDLEALPFNIFGMIQPKVAIITTFNADFNEYLKKPFKIGPYDFPTVTLMWSRQVFQDWCQNIIKRFPLYKVSFDEVGVLDNEELYAKYGAYQQIAVFEFIDEKLNNSRHKIELLDDLMLYKMKTQPPGIQMHRTVPYYPSRDPYNQDFYNNIYNAYFLNYGICCYEREQMCNDTFEVFSNKNYELYIREGFILDKIIEQIVDDIHSMMTYYPDLQEEVIIPLDILVNEYNAHFAPGNCRKWLQTTIEETAFLLAKFEFPIRNVNPYLEGDYYIQHNTWLIECRNRDHEFSAVDIFEDTKAYDCYLCNVAYNPAFDTDSEARRVLRDEIAIIMKKKAESIRPFSEINKVKPCVVVQGKPKLKKRGSDDPRPDWIFENFYRKHRKVIEEVLKMFQGNLGKPDPKDEGDKKDEGDDGNFNCDEAGSSKSSQNTSEDSSKNSDDASETSDDSSKNSDSSSKKSEGTSKKSEDISKKLEDTSKKSEDTYKTSEDTSAKSEDNQCSTSNENPTESNIEFHEDHYATKTALEISIEESTVSENSECSTEYSSWDELSINELKKLGYTKKKKSLQGDIKSTNNWEMIERPTFSPEGEWIVLDDRASKSKEE